jgi:hypothetical protein
MVKRKAESSQDPKREFKKIRQLKDPVVKKLDKLRTDLQEAILRTSRVNHAFIRELNKQVYQSDRVKHIIRALEEISYYCQVQSKVVDKQLSEILLSKEKKIQELKEKAAKKEKERKELFERVWL